MKLLQLNKEVDEEKIETHSSDDTFWFLKGSSEEVKPTGNLGPTDLRRDTIITTMLTTVLNGAYEKVGGLAFLLEGRAGLALPFSGLHSSQYHATNLTAEPRSGGVAVVVPKPVGGTSISRAAVDDLHATEDGPPFVLDQDGLKGPDVQIELSFTKKQKPHKTSGTYYVSGSYVTGMVQ